MKDKLSYFASRFSMFGIGFFLLFKLTGKDAWIAVILGTFIGVIILYIYKFIKNYFHKEDIREILKNSFIGKIFLFILLIFYLYLMVIILILLPLFVNAFYLLYTPKILVIIPFLLLSIYLSFKEKYVIESLSTLLFTFSILIILIYSSALTKYIDISRICPIFTIGSNKLIKASFLYASITSIPNILTIHYSKNNFQDDLKNYLYASLTNFIIVLFTILSLGEPLINIFSFPEYAVLKQIKILNFIENVENLSTFIWYFDMFITLSALTNNIKEVLPKKFNKIYFYLCILLVLFISIFVIGSNYQLILNTFYSYPWILFIFFIIFIILFIFLKNKPKNTP